MMRWLLITSFCLVLVSCAYINQELSLNKPGIEISDPRMANETNNPGSETIASKVEESGKDDSLDISVNVISNETTCTEEECGYLETTQSQNNTIEEKSVSEEDIDESNVDQSLLDAALDFYNAAQEYWSEGNLDMAMETLDQAYANVLQVKGNGDPEIIQQKDDLRFMISKRILEIYASRYTAVNGNYNEIPLDMNEHVKKEIKRFQGPERKYFLEAYKRAGRYIDMIKEEFKKAGLPEELAWLPLIESGFKVKALSRARALGLWQFIPSTGYKFGLKRDRWIDERLDPVKSTKAAIAYLKELHNIFGDWTTVLAGYNCGEGTVLQKIRNQRINYLDNFWDLYEQLPRETAQYVPRFLATLHILKDPQKYGFDLGEMDPPIEYETVEINKPVHLRNVARALNISYKTLKELNPELRRFATPPTLYELKVPPGMGKTLLAKLDSIPRWIPPENTYVYHRVKKGETLSLIALRYHTTVSRIVRANNLKSRHFIRAGQKLKIPLGSYRARTYTAASDELLPGGKYIVKKGDSLWLIARKFNTNTRKLQRLNNLKTTRLYVGQILQITDPKKSN